LSKNIKNGIRKPPENGVIAKMKLTILQWLLQGIPESLALVTLALALAGEKLEMRRIALLGIIEAVIIFAIRLLPLTFGVHSILSIFSMALLLNLFLKVRFSRSLLSALIVIIALAVVETVSLSLILYLTGLPYEQFSENVFAFILGGWSNVILLFLLALAVHRWQRGRRALKEEI